MSHTVVFHRRVEKKLKKKYLPREQVAKCVRLLSERQTDHLGLRMKRLKGIDRPVFEARVNRDVVSCTQLRQGVKDAAENYTILHACMNCSLHTFATQGVSKRHAEGYLEPQI